MTKHNLLAEIRRIHNKFSAPTPQVEKIANAIGSTLSSNNETGSLHVILGKTGSGCSTAIQMCRRRLRHKFKNIVTLRPLALNEEFNPWRLLLQYYGLYFNDADLKTHSIPWPIIDLIAYAEIDCIIVEDFAEGLNKPTDRQKAVEAWLGLAHHPICLTVIVATHNPTYGNRFSNEELATVHSINEWKEDEEFSSFIGKLQKALRDEFKIYANLNSRIDQLYKLCNGNTGNLFSLIREYAVAELLSPSNANSDITDYLPLKSITKQNAILFAAKSSQ